MKHLDFLTPSEIIQIGCREIYSDNLWACFSGGHDSLVSTYITSKHRFFKGVLHLDTGIGLPQTQKYVIDVCDRYGWDLKIYRANENLKKGEIPNYQFYEELVMRFGFPNANSHQIMYQRLKGYSVDRFRRDQKAAGRWATAFTTGIRWQESRRREKYQGEYFVKKSGKNIMICPILNFSDQDREDFIREHGLPKNPIYKYYCKSGECLCGAYASRQELLDIEKISPETYDRLMNIESHVRKKFAWGWGERIPKSKNNSVTKNSVTKKMLCYSCQNRFEEE